MSVHDLVETDCGGSNSLVKLSTHFVQDLAFKDQDLKQSLETESNEKTFLAASTGELADQFFSSTQTETFKMDTLLAEMRSVENNIHEDSWPSHFTKENEKQEQPTIDPNIWSSSENKMLVKDEVYDFGYNSEWIKEIEQSFPNQVANSTKSHLDFDKRSDTLNTYNTDPLKYDDLMESYKKMTVDNSFGIQLNNHFGPYWNLFANQNYNQDHMDDMYGLAYQNELKLKNIISSSTSETVNPILNDQQAECVKSTETSKNKFKIVDESSNLHDWFSEFEEIKNAENQKEYCFTTDNEMVSIENPLAEGKRRLENGELPTAVLCFEAAVKKDPSSAEAWQLLGTTQAENEQDQLAINALNKCLEIQPENLNAVLCLAACYTNESQNLQACQMLMEWLNQNPKYTDIVKSKPIADDTNMFKYMFTTKLYETVKDMYIEAAQRSLETGFVDADVQNGLGVLLNLNSENDKAVDCFKAALQIRPTDARLWNRLGASLANGGRCEEAIEAYHNALELLPGFVRARYNLGITCIHLNTYREAIEHLLEALNQQASVVRTNFQSPALSDTIWSTLRLAISMAERPDLLKVVNNRDLNLLNEEFSYNRSD
ncbi:Hypothetical protein CINCED_3A017187 [Cinara cedri]|nr:Hypothetical protein CINCED_3A017187 [Cinara cedri]